MRVLGHAEAALAVAGNEISASRALSVRLAALLHDADDRKYFPNCPKGEYPNARRLMNEAGAEEAVIADSIRMISLVSCSKNGNSAPPELASGCEWLFPRWADRLEATGEIGVVRCWQYNEELEVPAPLFIDSTPRPKTEDEVWALATPERFQKYQTSGGASDSMLDHYFDKLLQVARPPAEIVRNSYLEQKMQEGAEPLVRILLAFGQTGEVPMEQLKAMEARCSAGGA